MSFRLVIQNRNVTKRNQPNPNKSNPIRAFEADFVLEFHFFAQNQLIAAQVNFEQMWYAVVTSVDVLMTVYRHQCFAV